MGNNIEKINQLAQKGKAAKILPFLKSKDQPTRIAAIRGLGRCANDEEAYNNLTSLMSTTSDKEELIAIYDSLGELGKEQTFYHLSHYISKETDPQLLDAMRKAMAKIRQHKE